MYQVNHLRPCIFLPAVCHHYGKVLHDSGVNYVLIRMRCDPLKTAQQMVAKLVRLNEVCIY